MNQNINDVSDETSTLDLYLNELIYELNNTPQELIQIQNSVNHLKSYLSASSGDITSDLTIGLMPYLENGTEQIVDLLFPVCKIIVERVKDPWVLLAALLSSKKENLFLMSLDFINEIVSAGKIRADYKCLDFFYQLLSKEKTAIGSQNSIRKIAEIFSLQQSVSGENIVLQVYLGYKDKNLQIFSARLLDSHGLPPDDYIIKKLLGKCSKDFLSEYFNYTRLTYTELLYLTPVFNKSADVGDYLKKCESVCGKDLLQKAVAELGWSRVNYGISVKRYTGFSINGSLPLFVQNSEATIFEKAVKTRKVSEFYFFTAYGGLPLEENHDTNKSKTVSLFRSYNLAHAKLLGDIIDVAPLTPNKIRTIFTQMDNIVCDFIALFKSYSDECSILSEIYPQIKNKVLAELNNIPQSEQISADTVRLVQMFEDPHSMAEVRTIHGLKRYLHQKGLQLGFNLVDQTESPNKTISLLIASDSKILNAVSKINYADFEPVQNENNETEIIPYSVRIVIDGLERQLLSGMSNFPSINIFCYGNEVHYFVWFRNHPVFIRIDFSPPLQGGMIDLQYFGVSNYEIADHPNLNLESIRYLFQRLEFDVQMNGTQIHARYDKERALDLSQLSERAEYLFCLVPYLMDLDWIIGSLNLSPESKKKVTENWTDLFIKWRVLPFDKLLTKSRTSILKQIKKTPEGEKEIYWSGDDEYRDRYSVEIPSVAVDSLFGQVQKLGLNILAYPSATLNNFGQNYIEKRLLIPLRTALSRDAVVLTEYGFERAPENIFRQIHESEWFSELINKNGELFRESIILAKIIMPLERSLKFQKTGTLENFVVQCSILSLIGRSLKFYILRDRNSIIRMAFYTFENYLYQKRRNLSEDWRANACHSPAGLIPILRKNNYTISDPSQPAQFINEEIRSIKDELLLKAEPVPQLGSEGEQIANGLRASPGRAVGRVLIGTKGRLPEEFDDHIFVAPSVSPDDNTILFHASGVVATGGGILSHAGLIATQFNKPALIVSGKWQRGSDLSESLLFNTPDYQVESKIVNGFNISLFHNLREREHILREGDLVILNADEGKLHVLGQHTDTIALYEELKLLGTINENILYTADVNKLLILRGKKLHTIYQINKLFQRISSPALVLFIVQEILSGKSVEGNRSSAEERSHLLDLLLGNRKIRRLAEKFVVQAAEEFEFRFNDICKKAKKIISSAQYPFEVVIPRLEALEMLEIIRAASSLNTLHLEKIKISGNRIKEIDDLSLNRLEYLNDLLTAKVNDYAGRREMRELLRHVLRQLTRTNLLLGKKKIHFSKNNMDQEKFDSDDKYNFSNLADRITIKPGEGGLELIPLIGCKAANLSDLELVAGNGLVPPWFVITDKAFQIALGSSPSEDVFINGNNSGDENILYKVINRIIARTDINNKEKSLVIRNIWDRLQMPKEIRNSIITAFREIRRNLPDASDRELYFALRSSSCEEDAEISARAGEFETYLFISGEEPLIDYTKKTWSGLWTERAIHNRSVFKDLNYKTSGGVIVQQMVWSRVSGVLQTINVAKGSLKEIVINAGLGLGEGVVSGTVAADQIIVSKEGNLQKGPLRFNYITADKTEQVVFNKKAGYGTVRTSTLYHQRFRPALEYVELCELVSTASRLEEAYGYPIDIEFGFEGTKLWILQVRPVATFLPAFKKTIEKYPLIKRKKRNLQEKIK